jgi:hypothetical protein
MKRVGRHVWSGTEIVPLSKKKNKSILDSLSNVDIDIWRKGLHGIVKSF